MVINEVQLKEVKDILGEVSHAKEGGIDYIFIKNAPMPSHCTPQQCDILLCTSPKDGYESRLYFAQRVNGPGTRNWNGTVRVLDRNWEAFSMKVTHQSEVSLIEAIRTHLSGFREGFHP